jgi:hypothetical protein
MTDTNKPKKVAAGMVRLKAPKGTGSCSYEGVEYEVKDGFVDVPAEAAGDLAKHGFTGVED